MFSSLPYIVAGAFIGHWDYGVVITWYFIFVQVKYFCFVALNEHRYACYLRLVTHVA